MYLKTCGSCGRKSDAQPAWISSHFLKEWTRRGRRPVRIANIGTCRSIEEASTIPNGAGYGVVDYQSAKNVAKIRPKGIARPRRLETEESAARGWDPDRPATIIAMSHRNEAGSHSSR
jgi:hypothetical protein